MLILRAQKNFFFLLNNEIKYISQYHTIGCDKCKSKGNDCGCHGE